MGRRAKNLPARAAYRCEVRRTRSLPVWQNSNVLVPAVRFFLALAAKKQIQAKRSTAGASGGLGKLSFLAAVQELVPSNRAWGRGGLEEELQRSVLHVSPSIAPWQGSPRLEPAPRSASASSCPTPCSGTGQRGQRRRLPVPQCSLNITAGYARAPVRASFGDHQVWLGTSQAWNIQHPRARANRQHSEDAIEA